jgi:hypothetical protein
VLRRILEPKRDETTGGWRKSHNEELHNLYSSQKCTLKKSRRVRCAGEIEGMEKRNAYRVWVRKPERKRALGRPRSRWENNIKIDIKEMGGDGIDWMPLAQYRDIGTGDERTRGITWGH